MFYGKNKIDGSWGFHPDSQMFVTAVEISDAEHKGLLAGQQQGKEISHDENNYPVLITPLQPELDYQELRRRNYPDYRDFLDAQVKINSGDPELIAAGQVQQERYFAACLEVKAKYPKPGAE